tara:strand:+ start:1017 stop:1313 length:297 start_codon:yes stop_codon:yes gene_type:complete
MNIEIEDFIEVLNEGLKKYLEKNNYSVDQSFYEQLEKNLYKELSLPFNEQLFTPTQLLNDYVKKRLNLTFNLTPFDLGEEFRSTLLRWGVAKAKFLDE